MSAKRKSLTIWERAAKHGWVYDGDLTIECGGFFWKYDGDTDYVDAVRVTPCSDAGGPDNLFEITEGSIYFGQDVAKRNAMLKTIGWDDDEFIGPYELYLIVQGAAAYHGIERGTFGDAYVRIGKVEICRDGWNPKPDVILPGNARLDHYIFREYLS